MFKLFLCTLDFVKLGEGCGVKETPQQKYQRLVNEIQELTQEVDAIQVSRQRDTQMHPYSLSARNDLHKISGGRGGALQ